MTIVCVDPNKRDLRRVVKQTRKLEPFAEIAAFQDTPSALRFIELHPCDVLVTEIDFPVWGPDGLMLTELLMKMRPEARTIIVSGDPDGKAIYRRWNLPILEYITKPCQKKHLERAFYKLQKTEQSESPIQLCIS